MNKFIMVVILIICLSSTALATITQDNLNITDDTYLDTASTLAKNKNHGGSGNLIWNSVSNTMLFYHNLTYVVPKNSTITSYIINFYQIAGSSNSRSIIFFPMNRSWNEGTGNITTNDASINGTTGFERWYEDNLNNNGCSGPEDPDWCVNGTGPGDYYQNSNITVPITGGNGWYSYNLTTLVKQMFNGSLPDYGFAVKNGSSSDQTYAGKEYNTGYRRPNVSIAYDLPTPLFTVYTPLNNSKLNYLTVNFNCTADMRGRDSYANISQFWVYICTDANCSSAPELIYSGSLNDTTTPQKSNNVTFNGTYEFSSEGTFYWACSPDAGFENGLGTQFWDVDSAGNFRNQITIDMSEPVISITYPPSDNQTYTNNTLNLTYTITDVITAVDKCWYSKNYGIINYTLSSCNNGISNETWLYGLNNVTIYANDSANNLASLTRQFNITNASDPCSCPGATANWVISTSCVWSGVTCNLGNYNLTIATGGQLKMSSSSRLTAKRIIIPRNQVRSIIFDLSSKILLTR